jgi:polar amino acid transport system permease protein
MTSNGDDAVKVVPVRHYSRWAGTFVVLILLAMLIHTIFSKIGTGINICVRTHGLRHCHQPQRWRFYWNVVFHFFTSSDVIHGLYVTLELTVAAMTIGIVLGVILAVMRRSQSRLLSSTAWTYTWFFRGTPVLVQLLFWFNIAALYKTITIGLPFLPVTFVHLNVLSILNPFRSAVLALGLNEAAYMSEIARAGLLAVDEGQIEAATSIGMTRIQSLRLVVLPQAMRVIIPPTGNEVISMLKTTSLVSVVGVTDLLAAVTNISAVNFLTMALLIVASIWYLIVTTILSIGQFYLERHYAKGALRNPPPTPIQRLRGDLKGVASKYRTKRGVPAEVPT